MRKKKNIIIGVLVVILTILVCVLLFIVGKKYDNTSYSNIIDLDYVGLKEKLDNKDTFVLSLTQTSCTHCKAFLPVLNEVGQEYNLTFYKIEIDLLEENDLNSLKQLFSFSGTPTTVFINDGEERTTTSRLDGEKTKDKIIARLKKEGYINE